MLAEFNPEENPYHHSLAALVYGALAKRDPAKAWATLASSPYKRSPDVVKAVTNIWGKWNPREAMESVRGDPTTLRNSAFIRGITETWGKESFADFMQWLAQEPDRGRWEDDIAWETLQPTTPAEFAAWLQALPSRMLDPYSEGSGLLEKFYDKATHLQEMPAWLRSLPRGQHRAAAVRAYTEHLLEIQPDAALAWREEISDAAMRRRITSTAAAWLTWESPQEGLKVAESLSFPETRQDARQSVIDTWATFDRTAAIRAALAHPEWKVDLGDVVRDWAHKEPDVATLFTFQNNMGERRRIAMHRWVERDPQAASDWVARVPPGQNREDAIAMMAEGAMRNDPAGALRWAMTLQDPGRRQRLMDSGFRGWSGRSLTDATSWLANSSLPAGDRQRLGTFLPTVTP
jgi:hypothetical protein